MDLSNLLTDTRCTEDARMHSSKSAQSTHRELDAKFNGSNTKSIKTEDRSMLLQYHQQDGSASSGAAGAQPHRHSLRRQGIDPNAPKRVAFELLLDGGFKARARIPMRVVIHPHDTLESIIATVKAFYAIHDGLGISFEDECRNPIIVQHENLSHDMIIYIRTVALPTQYPSMMESPRKPSLGDPIHLLLPPGGENSHMLSRPTSRLARNRSISPQAGRGRRSVSQQKLGSNSGAGSRGSSTHGSYHDDAANGYSDSDNGRGSITGSRKARSEQFASADISQDNIVQDGRRNKINFESFELPLYLPPQMPMNNSISSISPQRKPGAQDGQSPFAVPAQRAYGWPPPVAAPPQALHYGHAGTHDMIPKPSFQPPSSTHRLRERQQPQPRLGIPREGNTLPTPDPTVASCISDEDVARQLIALSDATNFSYGRTSASTLDETFSGVADVASSTGATSDSDEYSDEDVKLTASRKGRQYSAVADDEYAQNGMIKGEFDDYEGAPKPKKIKTKSYDGSMGKPKVTKSVSNKLGKPIKARASTIPKMNKTTSINSLMKAPSAPTFPGQPRKMSNSSNGGVQHTFGPDEEDLSSKPRCQRCRKSKKGCDRQRPCQRCKDAGIGSEGCVSEDEGNGRKGRYGRHMGIAVKKGAESVDSEDDDSYQAPDLMLSGIVTPAFSPDKSKKRKR